MTHEFPDFPGDDELNAARETWRERLRSVMDARKIKMRPLSARAGLGQTFVRDILERGREPGIDAFRAIADALGVSVSYLLTGTDEPEAHDELKKHIGSVNFQPETVEPPEYIIRVFGEVQAGVFTRVDAAPEEHKLEASVFPPDPRYPREAQFDLIVRGTSLNRIANEGERLRCVDIHKANVDIRDGDPVIVRRTMLDGSMVETTAKRFRMIGGRPELWPESTDPRWQMEIDILDGADGHGDVTVEIQAVVLFAYRPITRT